MEDSAVDSGPLATAGLHASGDVDATATQAKAEDAGEAKRIIDGWSGVGTSGTGKWSEKHKCGLLAGPGGRSWQG